MTGDPKKFAIKHSTADWIVSVLLKKRWAISVVVNVSIELIMLAKNICKEDWKNKDVKTIKNAAI